MACFNKKLSQITIPIPGGHSACAREVRNKRKWIGFKYRHLKNVSSQNQRNGQSGVKDLKDLELHLDLNYSQKRTKLILSGTGHPHIIASHFRSIIEYNTVTERLNEHFVV